jgi:hypothetical protein
MAMKTGITVFWVVTVVSEELSVSIFKKIHDSRNRKRETSILDLMFPQQRRSSGL